MPCFTATNQGLCCCNECSFWGQGIRFCFSSEPVLHFNYFVVARFFFFFGIKYCLNQRILDFMQTAPFHRLSLVVVLLQYHFYVSQCNISPDGSWNSSWGLPSYLQSLLSWEEKSLKQAVQALIRYRVLQCLIWFCSVVKDVVSLDRELSLFVENKR